MSNELKRLSDLNIVKGSKKVKEILSELAMPSILMTEGEVKQSGYKYLMSPCAPADIVRLKNSVYGDILTEQQVKYKTIYDKLVNTNLDENNVKISYKTFLENTLLCDVDRLMFDLYCVTFPVKSNIPLICHAPVNPKTKNNLKQDVNSEEKTNAQLIEEALKANKDETKELPKEEKEEDDDYTGESIIAPKSNTCEHITEFTFNADQLIMKEPADVSKVFSELSDDGIVKNHKHLMFINNDTMAVTLKAPTLKKQLDIYKETPMSYFETYSDLIAVLLYVDTLYYKSKTLDESGKEQWIELTEFEKIFEQFSSPAFDIGDFNAISIAAANITNAITYSFTLPETVCEKCSAKLGGISIQMDDIFRRRYNQSSDRK